VWQGANVRRGALGAIPNKPYISSNGSMICAIHLTTSTNLGDMECGRPDLHLDSSGRPQELGADLVSRARGRARLTHIGPQEQLLPESQLLPELASRALGRRSRSSSPHQAARAAAPRTVTHVLGLEAIAIGERDERRAAACYTWPLGPPGTARHEPGLAQARTDRARPGTTILTGHAVPLVVPHPRPKHEPTGPFCAGLARKAQEFRRARRLPLAGFYACRRCRAHQPRLAPAAAAACSC
jgi:hypothetical protein